MKVVIKIEKMKKYPVNCKECMFCREYSYRLEGTKHGRYSRYSCELLEFLNQDELGRRFFEVKPDKICPKCPLKPLEENEDE